MKKSLQEIQNQNPKQMNKRSYNIIYQNYTGSRLFGIENYKDTDLFLLVDYLPNNLDYKSEYDKETNTDYFIETIRHRKKIVYGELYEDRSIYLLQDIIYQKDNNYPIKFNYLNYEKKFKENMLYIVRKFMVFNPKRLYWIYILFKMWEYQSDELREEYKQVIQDCKKNNYDYIKEYIEKEFKVIHNG